MTRIVRAESVSAAIATLMLLAPSSSAVKLQPQEFATTVTWCDRVFSKTSQPSSPAYLKILFEDAHDGVSRGKSWRGTPFQLGEKVYAHGLAFNSIKHILVHLGRPAERFTADVGLENNDDTQRGAAQGMGSVTFQILVGGKEVFSSPVMRLKDGGCRWMWR